MASNPKAPAQPGAVGAPSLLDAAKDLQKWLHRIGPKKIPRGLPAGALLTFGEAFDRFDAAIAANGEERRDGHFCAGCGCSNARTVSKALDALAESAARLIADEDERNLPVDHYLRQPINYLRMDLARVRGER